MFFFEESYNPGNCGPKWAPRSLSVWYRQRQAC